MATEQQKDLEAAEHLKTMMDSLSVVFGNTQASTLQAYRRAISALEDRAKAAPASESHPLDTKQP